MKKLSLFLAIVMTVALFVPCMSFSVAAEGEDAICEIVSGTETTPYTSLDDATIELLDGDTLRLLADVTVEAEILLQGDDIVFDGNGFKISSTASNVFFVSGLNNRNLGYDYEGSITPEAAATLPRVTVTIQNVFVETNAATVFQVGNKTTLNLIDVYAKATSGYIVNGKSFAFLGSVYNFVSGSYIGNKSDGPVLMFASDNVANFYGGYYQNTTTSSARCEQNEGTSVVNVYGGTFVHDTYREVMKALGSDTDKTNGYPVINLYGGTMINAKTGRGGDTFCALGEKDGEINECTFAVCLQTALCDGTSSKSPEKLKGTVSDENAIKSGDDQYEMFNIAGQDYYMSYQKQIPISTVAEKSVKFGADREGNTFHGIRFMSGVHAELIEYVESVKDEGTEVSYGTVILPADYANKYGLSLDRAIGEGLAVVDIKAENGLTIDEEEGHAYFYASLTNIKEANIARDFAAVAYVEYVVNGFTVRQYGLYDATQNVNLAALAVDAIAAALEDETLYNDDQIAVLEAFAAFAPAVEE